MTMDSKIADFQAKLDRIADDLGVTNVLVMKADDLSVKVDLSGGPEKDKFPLGAEETRSPEKKIYCVKVIETDGLVVVNDSKSDEEWKGNIDEVQHGLVSYVGVPLHGPDGTVQGTVCAVDKKPRKFEQDHIKIITDLRDEIEKSVVEK